MTVAPLDSRPTSAQYDVIVVGSGIAGLYAALLAAPHSRALLLSKGSLEESNTRYAQGGIAAALSPDDSPDLHLRDTIAAGDGLCDPAHVSILTREAPDCILDLLQRGVPFDRDGGELAWTREAAHSIPRVLHAGGDATGASVEQTLAAAVREAGITIREHALCVSLLVAPTMGGGSPTVEGVALQLEDGRTAEARASHVILATGGAGQLFARTTNPSVATGDGLAIAYRAGAELMDLEFMQFHPTALVLPRAPSFLISEAVRGEGGILRDVTGRAFMADYHPDRELAPRDVVARAIHQQMLLTDSPQVWLDVTHLPTDLVERRFPNILRFCRLHGIDPIREAVPVAPAAHYLMGGIHTDAWGRTNLPGLLACGEAACTGVHGANRLASNSLLEGLVFARRAVQGMVAPHPPAPSPARGRGGVLDKELPSFSPLPRAGEPLRIGAETRRSMRRAERFAGPGVRVRQDLADLMWRHASLVRSRDSLETARAALTGIRAQLPDPTFDPNVGYDDHELANLMLLAGLVVDSALLRQESRGAHFRADFPHHEPSWQGHIVVSRSGTRFTPLSGLVAVHAGQPDHD